MTGCRWQATAGPIALAEIVVLACVIVSQHNMMYSMVVLYSDDYDVRHADTGKAPPQNNNRNNNRQLTIE